MKRDHVAAAKKYALDVTKGYIPACRFVKLACKRHLDDLKQWGKYKKSNPYWFDEKAANKVCNFIELLPHTKGKWAAKNETIHLEPWQQFIECVRFGWKRQNGTRRFRKSYEEIPRKNGKSIRKAATGLFMAFADSEYGAEVYSGATSEKQAFEVFKPAWLMAHRTPALIEHYSLQQTGNSKNPGPIYCERDGSKFEVIIGKPGDGASPSYAIHDEYHEHDSPDQSDTMETGMGAREQPLQDFITTAGDNLAGPCYDLRNYAIEVLEGRIENDEFFAIIYTIDEKDDWTSEESLRKANPNFDVSVSAEFLLSKQREAIQSARKQNAFKTKHLNLWVGARDAYINMQEWYKCPKALPLEQLLMRPCFAGLDLASKIDIAARILLFPPFENDKYWHVHPFFYLPEDMTETGASTNSTAYDAWAKEGYITLTPGNVIDFNVIEDDIRELPQQFAMQEIGFDPWQATQMATTLSAEGVPMVEVGQTVKNFSDPMKTIEALVKQKLLAHPRNKVLDWMVSNVTAQEDKKENVFPTKKTVDAKIDGFVGLCIAVNRAISQAPVLPSVYETRGIVEIEI